MQKTKRYNTWLILNSYITTAVSANEEKHFIVQKHALKPLYVLLNSGGSNKNIQPIKI